MTRPQPEITVDTTGTGSPDRRSLRHVYAELTKARLSALVLFTTAVGFIMAADDIDWFRLAWTTLGTALAAGCANALNEIIERDRDGQMHRTRSRPLPAGIITVRHATFVALAMGVLGVGVLAVLVNTLAAALALLTIVLYVALYTPLKIRSTLNTLVGAVCGAIPPVIGWVAAAGTLDARAGLLAALLFVWQLPHFMALAWMYRADYARGRFRMLPVLDPTGELTSQVVVSTSLLLLPIGLAFTIAGLTGLLYAAGSIVLGVGMVLVGTRLYQSRSEQTARAVFLASIIYLPILMGLMIIDRGPAAALLQHRMYAAGQVPVLPLIAAETDHAGQ